MKRQNPTGKAPESTRFHKAQDKDKTFLLEFSHSVASSRTRRELSSAIHSALKTLTEVRAYFIRTINDDLLTMSPFMHDNDVSYMHSPAFKTLLATPIPLDKGITARVLASNTPVCIDFAQEVEKGNTDHYIEFWKTLGSNKAEFQKIFGTKLHMADRALGVLWVITPGINIALLEGLCAQISVAISNIKSNEDIAEREEEKSILLSISGEIAALRNRDDLLKVVSKQLKVLFSIEDFGFLQINSDDTYSPFFLDLKKTITSRPEFADAALRHNSVKDPVFTTMISSEDPVIFDVNQLCLAPDMPEYVHFWKKLGLRRVLGTALRVGGKNIGCAFLHIDANKSGKIKINLLKAVCAQISVAISNIRSNEEIVDREKEKSILLSLSEEFAALRNRNDLSRVVNTRIKTLLSVSEFGIAQINDSGLSYSAFVLDVGDHLRNQSDFKNITSSEYSVGDPVFNAVMNSPDPVVLDVENLSTLKEMPAYVHFWHRAGIKRVMGAALRVGGRPIGCAFLHLDIGSAQKIKIRLVKAVCAQLSVAVSNIIANEQVLSYKQMLEIENDRLKEQLKNLYNFSEIIGSGPEMQKVYHMMSLVAEANSTVLLLGETGTGKELIARAIHNASPRKNKPMVKVNCAALPTNLIESELFGHEKGSFTGAVDRRIGKFEIANNSTIFLDEIGEMPLEMQVKLLRVIQEREFERVGGKATLKVDVRIIAATNRNLEDEVKAGRFRSDLYYRLNVFPITLPPLRKRPEDITPLAEFFVARYSKISGRKVTSIAPKVIQKMKSYSWPGNVRELEHLIERSILLNPGNVLHEIDLPDDRVEAEAGESLFQRERLHIIETLKRCNGKVSGLGGAADVLDLPSTTLRSKMKKLGISKTDYLRIDLK